MCACVRVCVRACVRACMRACVCIHVCVHVNLNSQQIIASRSIASIDTKLKFNQCLASIEHLTNLCTLVLAGVIAKS